MTDVRSVGTGAAIRSPSSAVSGFFIMMLLANSSQMFLAHYQDELLAVSAVIAMLAMHHYRKVPSPLFLIFVSSLLLWVVFIVVQYDVWNIKTFIGFLCRIFLAYAVVAILRDRFFPALLEVVYKLTIISLSLYFIGVLSPVVMQQLHSVLNLMPDLFIIDNGEYTGWIRANFLIYTFSVERLYQNHGFMWEPSAFAAILLLVMMIHLTLNKCRLDRKFKVFLVALVTTFSTTGWIAFVFVVLFILMNGKANYKVIVGLTFIAVAPFVFNLDMISGKIEKEFVHWDDISFANLELTMSGNSRLSSFIFDIRDFLEHPLLGIGIFEENRHLGHQVLGSVNGVGDTFSRFGLIISFLFLMNLALSFRRFAHDNRAWGYLLFILLFLTLSWAERLTNLPLFFAFQFYHFLPRRKIKIQKLGTRFTSRVKMST